MPSVKKKRPVVHRFRQLGRSTKVPSVLAPYVLHLFRRHVQGMRPGGDLESRLHGRLGNLPEDARRELRQTISNLDRVPLPVRKTVFDRKYLALPLQRPPALNSVLRDLAREAGQRLWEHLLPRAGRPAGGSLPPGVARPTMYSDPEFLPVPVELLQPRICRVNGIMDHSFTPAPNPWPTEELQRKIRVASEGTTVDEGLESGGCRAGTTPAWDLAHPGACLRVASVGAGEMVRLTGVNFINNEAELVFVPAAGGAGFTLRPLIAGDLLTPGEIADCRVEDTAMAVIPRDTPPGSYRVYLRFPNPGMRYRDIGHLTGAAPAWLESNTAHIDVIAPPDQQYTLDVDSLHCDEETDGLGADEVGLSFRTAGVSFGGAPEWASVQFPIIEDVDSGETVRFRTPPSSYPHRLFSGPAPDLLLVGVEGFEVDDEELYRTRTTAYWDAVGYGLGEVVGAIGTLLGDLLRRSEVRDAAFSVDLEDLADLKEYLIPLAVALAVAAAVLLIWAAWARPDLIMRDLLILGREDLYSLTDPRVASPMPDVLGTDHGGIHVSGSPVRKRAGESIIERRYRSEDEDSTYALRLALARLP
jgi:hypothetical protein